MKFAIATLALASIASAASAGNSGMQASAQSQAEALDIGKLLGGLKPLLKKAKCVAPCFSKKTDALECSDKGPLSTICTNIDNIARGCEGVIKKCGVDKSTTGTVSKVLKDMCATIETR
ncbi:hypothetical protein L249_0497 [Ophiocordyceps polyrhachis-furcata BCC 54312]|uniref:Extracellular membrane protein CFEM domain-containing protein n=1 Tax=Ophiocordyceps polyrhachis-furcata BCC 54312 TaxID=1330021 RepID=A0A367LCY2_9HYPO|nr:hypothetical protein L249_0497 [Ophiocordyceps polyrhachis-furcata BCC 54312]